MSSTRRCTAGDEQIRPRSLQRGEVLVQRVVIDRVSSAKGTTVVNPMV
ncbi:hypothetical protein [Halocatena marina]|nr:hypothetical protein [Halocatena marina]